MKLGRGGYPGQNTGFPEGMAVSKGERIAPPWGDGASERKGRWDCMDIPTKPWTLMRRIRRDVLPAVKRQLSYWEQRALAIPDPELKKQALASLSTKAFHCYGGAIYSLLSGPRREEVVAFIVAYQTISDYLDNLCDRSTSLDPDDFRALHEAMTDALTPGAVGDYYRFRKERNDGGYLAALVAACQRFLATLPALRDIQPVLYELADYYTALQIHKHVVPEERVPRLKKWFEQWRDRLPALAWYEFSACCGSTLGVFCIVAYAAVNRDMSRLVRKIKDGYFPWVQGLHILLDYFIDQEEDKRGGDLNFCFYYEDEKAFVDRFRYFVRQANASIAGLPNARFHRMITQGLIGLYLGDQKVLGNRRVRRLARQLIRGSGAAGWFFLLNGVLYHRMASPPSRAQEAAT